MSEQSDQGVKGPKYAGLIVSGVAVLLSLAMIELAARWVLDDGMQFDLEMWKYANDLKRVSANPEISHEHEPGAGGGLYMGVPVKINAQGLRDREYASVEKEPGVVRTLMLGDSLTFGWGVRVEDTPSKLLEALLNRNSGGKRQEVINSGVGNYNTSMEVAYFLEKGYAWQPDVVVLNYFINDAEPTPIRHGNFIVENSYAAVLALSAIDQISRSYFGRADWRAYYQDLYRPDAEGWSKTKSAIEKLAAYCAEHQIKLVIANYPELHVLDDYPFPDATNAVSGVAQLLLVPFIDLLPAVKAEVPATLWVSPGDAHPNATANRKYAALIQSRLEQLYPELYLESAGADISSQ